MNQKLFLIFFIIIFILYYFKCNYFRKTPKWGNLIDGLTNSLNENTTISKFLIQMNIGNIKKAEEKYNIEIHSLPPLKGGNLLRIEHDNHLKIPYHILGNQQVQNYIKQLHLKRIENLNQNEKKQNFSNTIIIHLRLGDILYTKHDAYLLSKLHWYQNAITKVKNALDLKKSSNIQTQPYKLIIMTNFKDNDTKSIKIAKMYFDNLNADELITNHSEEQDIYAMMNCSGLISTISSFSFYIGLISNHVWCTTCLDFQKSKYLIKLRPNIIYEKADFFTHNEINTLII
jgi:hypothetical protein